MRRGFGPFFAQRSSSCARIEARRVETPKVAPFTRVSPLTAFSTWCSL